MTILEEARLTSEEICQLMDCPGDSHTHHIWPVARKVLDAQLRKALNWVADWLDHCRAIKVVHEEAGGEYLRQFCLKCQFEVMMKERGWLHT